MLAAFDQTASDQHQDQVGIADFGQTMGDDHPGPATAAFAQVAQDLPGGLRIQRRGWLVEQQQARRR